MPRVRLRRIALAHAQGLAIRDGFKRLLRVFAALGNFAHTHSGQAVWLNSEHDNTDRLSQCSLERNTKQPMQRRWARALAVFAALGHSTHDDGRRPGSVLMSKLGGLSVPAALRGLERKQNWSWLA